MSVQNVPSNSLDAPAPHRRNAARSDRSKGLGLGLFITQQIVLAHGGHVEIRSTAAEGTTFSVFLPRSVEKVAAPADRLLP